VKVDSLFELERFCEITLCFVLNQLHRQYAFH